MKSTLILSGLSLLFVAALASCETPSDSLKADSLKADSLKADSVEADSVEAGDLTICLSIIEPAIVVEVQNQKTGEYIGSEVEGHIITGNQRYPLVTSEFAQTNPTPIVKSLAARAGGGTYDMYIESESYESWSRKDVEVDEHECGAKTVNLEAKLRPIE